jgi:hypothetical protein
MKKVFAQIWEESELGQGTKEDGISLHLTFENAKNFIKSVYKDRDSRDVPNSYERVVGEIIEIKISNSLYKELNKNKLGLRVPQHSFTNLKNLGEIKFIYDDNLYC